MKKVKILFALTNKEIEEKISQFQFKESDFSYVIQVNNVFKTRVRCEAFYEKQDEICNSFYVYVTLGKEIDALYDQYMLEEKLFEAYIIECLSMVYLGVAYDKIFQAMEVQERLSVDNFYYWEEKNTLESLAGLIKNKKITGISCDENGFMNPTKSVVMIVEMAERMPKQQKTDLKSEIAKCLECTHKCERGKKLCEARSQYLQGL